MGGFSDLFTDKSKTKEQNREWGSGSTNVDKTTDSFTTSLKDIISNIDESTVGVLRKGTKASNDYLQRILKDGSAALSGLYGKDKAISDSKDAMDAAIASVLESGLPDIRSGRTASGGYDDTTSKLLTDNLSAQAGKAGAQIVQDNINSYADIQLQGAEVLNQVAGLISDSNVNSSENVTATQDSSETGTDDTLSRELASIIETHDNSQIGSGTTRKRGTGLAIAESVVGFGSGTPTPDGS